MYQAEGSTTSLMDAIRNVFLRPADGETKVGQACRCTRCSAVGGLRFRSTAAVARCCGLAQHPDSARVPCSSQSSQVVHRLAVFDSHGEITNVITQTGKQAVGCMCRFALRLASPSATLAHLPACLAAAASEPQSCAVL